jgi:hypothetical protein
MNSSPHLEPIFENFPKEIIQKPCWVVWKNGKIPYSPDLLNSKANVCDPYTWGTFKQAVAAYSEGGYLGVGLVLTGDGLVGIDVDDCVQEGVPDSSVVKILKELDCGYIEFSPSGQGLRGFGLWGKPFDGKRGKLAGLPDNTSVEIYSRSRYLTVTGHVVFSDGIRRLANLDNLRSQLTSCERHKRTEDNLSHIYTSSESFSPLLCSSVADVIIPSKYLPNRPGQRNNALFKYTRFLKAKFPNHRAEDMRQLIKLWHSQAAPNIKTLDFAITWSDFFHGWSNVKYPEGLVLSKILNRMSTGNFDSDRFERLGYGNEAIKLAHLCRELQIEAGNSPFFLSCRIAGEVVGIAFHNAAKILNTFVKDQILELVEIGRMGKASRYRYL